MTSVIYHDIEKRTKHLTTHDRPAGANYDVLLYADDTAVISKSTNTISIIVQEIEKEAGKYGLKFNRAKCIMVKQNTEGKVYNERKWKEK
eukprot:6903772-Lingulodinium_polyedra.AAC.1